MIDTEEKVFEFCHVIFDRCPQPFGVAKMKFDEAHRPIGFTYVYMNQAMASLTDSTPDMMLGIDPYVVWENSDMKWANYFNQAAMENTPVEFEAISAPLKTFHHVTAFPIVKGFCGFTLQDITKWTASMHTTMKNVSAGILYFDRATGVIMLTDPALDIVQIDRTFLPFAEVGAHIFEGEYFDQFLEQLELFRSGKSVTMLFEGCLKDGRWIRLSLSHIGQADRFAFGIIEDISLLKQIELSNEETMTMLEKQKVALEHAVELAKNANEAKSTFLTNMSHDFRTPMNSIMGFANIALEHLNDTDRVKNSLEKILISSNHLLNLVNEILDVSRIESGKIWFSEEPCTLSSMFENLRTIFSQQIREKSIDFVLDMRQIRHDDVITDKLRFDQIMVNVIGNAIKFTPEHGKIEVIMVEQDDGPKDYGFYRIIVADTGCGMPAEFIDKLFLPFERASNSMAKRIEGTGLGMTITKSLVDLMGGTIEVESEEGRGTTFVIRLPLRLQNTDRHAAHAPKDEPHHARDIDFTGKRILVADDDEMSCEIFNETLGKYGFEVDTVNDGDDAVARITAMPEGYYDVVIMDMRMNRMDGDIATGLIRALPRDDVKTMPIIAATADAFEEVRKRSKEAGMTAYITKPLNTHKLIDVLAEYA